CILFYCRHRLKFIVLLLSICLLFNEWLIYHILPLIKWPKLSKLPLSSDELKILLIGDPQLLGDYFTGSSLLGHISQWDSDRFVQKTFNLALNHIQPDVIILLGDNLDEGEIASDQKYKKYINRFLNIFSQLDFNKVIIIPGDNDIGGENGDALSDKIDRFDSYFKKDVFLNVKFAEFVKVNYLTRSSEYEITPKLIPGKIRIILSHVPLTPIPSYFVKKVLSFVQPHLIFSAHEHISMHIVSDRYTQASVSTIPTFNEQGTLERINLTNDCTHEILVPTCSYRMGTEKMGYGMAILYPNGVLYYSVLWLPSRLKQLYFYLGLGLTCLLLLMPLAIWKPIDRWTERISSLFSLRQR
ncbi:uncharacterized protein LOC111612568, partial [Centruroides sculpturatus]|uniref:uncharacterized protein LOC111612568 n=1 Tax=Centruroides sculpturatus TaxID=218467 RepID=UPI000C6D69F0